MPKGGVSSIGSTGAALYIVVYLKKKKVIRAFSVLLLWASGGGCKSCVAVCFRSLAVAVYTVLVSGALNLTGALNLLWIS